MNRTTGLIAIGMVTVGALVGVVMSIQAPATTARATSPQEKQEAFAADRLPAIDPEDPMPRDKFAADRGAKAADVKTFPIDGDRAMKYLKKLCDIGPRVSNTNGMAMQQAIIIKHFEGFGAKVARQEFKAKQRSQKNEVPMTNLVISWFPDRKKRVIICSHYDTRPSAHEEPKREAWNKPFVSANDGTGAVALMMELAHHLKDFPTNVGLDFVLFDGEEYIFDIGVPGIKDGDEYFFGSKHFGAEYTKAKQRLPFKYEAAILLDLCCGENARLAVEGYSWAFAPQLVKQVWDTAAAIGAKSFVFEQGFQRAIQVQDDHLALNEAGILAIDIIDFDYAHWHLLSDTPDKVSPKQVVEVSNVLLAWLQLQK